MSTCAASSLGGCKLDEVWTFNYCKKRNVTPEIAAKHPDAGDVWLWCGIDADSKLVASWRVGQRDPGDGVRLHARPC